MQNFPRRDYLEEGKIDIWIIEGILLLLQIKPLFSLPIVESPIVIVLLGNAYNTCVTHLASLHVDIQICIYKQ